jgi:hypothetical protein
LQPRCDIGRIPQSQLLVSLPAPDLTNHHQPGVDADAQAQAQIHLLRQPVTEPLNGLDDTQPAADGSLGVILVGHRVAKINQQAISQILGHVPFKTGNDGHTHRLIGPHHLMQILRVKTLRQSG